MMIHTLLLIIVLLFQAKTFAQSPAFQIINHGTEKQLVLEETLKNQIKLFDPLFKPMDIEDFSTTVPGFYQRLSGQLPMAVMGDFDGDGKGRDLALMGTSGQRIRVLMAIQQKNNNYKIVSVQSWASPEKDKNGKWNKYLFLAAQDEKRMMEFPKKYDLLKVEVLFGTTYLFYYDSGKIKDFTP